MENLTFELDNNKYKILKVIAPDDMSVQYLIYTDGINKYASRYEFNNGSIILNPVNEENEWIYINEVMKEV